MRAAHIPERDVMNMTSPKTNAQRVILLNYIILVLKYEVYGFFTANLEAKTELYHAVGNVYSKI